MPSVRDRARPDPACRGRRPRQGRRHAVPARRADLGHRPASCQGAARGETATEDLDVSPGRFFAFRTLGGTLLGHAGFEIYGGDALIRSLAVREEQRGKGAARAMLQLLSTRAFEQGARRAFVLTTTAADLFRKAGYADMDRSAAPAAILGTPQAASLCPSSATLLARRITL
nr:GNAT family N-acetyltransferase [Methylobrevis pamukkalensis]